MIYIRKIGSYFNNNTVVLALLKTSVSSNLDICWWKTFLSKSDVSKLNNFVLMYSRSSNSGY